MNINIDPNKIERRERLKDLIDMLQGDIDCFGPAGDDISRLNAYKLELKQLEKEIKEGLGKEDARKSRSRPYQSSECQSLGCQKY